MAALSKPIQYALLTTLLAVGWLAFTSPDLEKKSEKAKSTQTRTRIASSSTMRPVTLQASPDPHLIYPKDLNRMSVGRFQQDLFIAKDWLAQMRPPEPPQNLMTAPVYVPPSPPPAPVAPPLDYQYIGRLTDGGVLHLYLVVQGSNVVLSTGQKKDGLFVVGDIIANDYRIDSISSSSVQLTYLPLNQAQALTIGG